MVAPLISMRALSEAAARLWYQAGMLAAPLADAAISQPPFPSETQPRGVVRYRPLLRPVVVRSRRSKSKPGGFLAPLRSRLATKPLIPSMMRLLGCQAPRVPGRASKVDMGCLLVIAGDYGRPPSVHVIPSWRHRQKGCPTG